MAGGHPLSKLKTIFVTGAHDTEVLDVVDVLGSYFDKVYTKELLLPEETDLGAQLRKLYNVQAALVDQEVCKRAQVFIGNNHSGWSELTYWQRAYDPRLLSYGSYGDHSDTDLMVNAQESHEPVVGPMHEFCPANGKAFGVTCKYFRTHRRKLHGAGGATHKRHLGDTTGGGYTHETRRHLGHHDGPSTYQQLLQNDSESSMQ
ncbi:hypothetical protein JKP88DRAFT_252826 [Tribonema minus]|uniref:Uncharacterized protein n=1 Tax=Tribonema minus TaxID=303371 RepID=A0A835ZAB2_9STRA|nr:hypothetical protein JKP88DRAFT_252826 [Tribonema minus]